MRVLLLLAGLVLAAAQDISFGDIVIVANASDANDWFGLSNGCLYPAEYYCS